MTGLIAITFIIMLAAISPGPDFAMVVKNTLLYGRKAGVLTSLGISTSLLIHSSYCVLGLAIIITQSLLLFSIIKYIGAAYLIYIGIKSLLTKHKDTQSEGQKSNIIALNGFQLFSQGFLCNLLNPKAIMFILAFFTLIIHPSTSWLAQFGFGFEIALIHMVWFSGLSTVITHQRVKANLTKFQHYIVKVMGAVLIAFGAHIAFLRQVVSV